MLSLEPFEGLQFRKATDEFTLEELLHFTNVQKGDLTDEIEIHLWNSWHNTSKDTATGIRIGVQHAKKNAADEFTGGTNPLGQETIDERWIEVKSNGIVNSDGKTMTDDAMTEFVPIGGNILNPLNTLLVGDIPANCARKLQLRLRVLVDADSIGMVRFIPFAIAE